MKKKGSGKRSHPKQRSGHAICCSRELSTTYLVGGYNDSGPLCDIWEFDTTWRECGAKSKLQNPFPRVESGCCLVAGVIYIFGGIQQDDENISILNDVWGYDVKLCTWTKYSDESECSERSGHVMVAINEEELIVHGGDCMRPLDDLWILNCRTLQWTAIITECGLRPAPRSSHSASFCESSKTLCVFGGQSRSMGPGKGEEYLTYLNDIWIIRTDAEKTFWQWQQVELVTLAPSPRDAAALTFVDDSTLLLYGGFGLSEEEGEAEIVHAYVDANPQTDLLTPLPESLDNSTKATSVGAKSHETIGIEDLTISNLSLSVLELSVISIQSASGNLSGCQDSAMQSSPEVAPPSTNFGGLLEENETERDQMESAEVDVDDGDEDDKSNSDDEEVVEAYLGDAWLINVRSRQAVEIDLNDFIIGDKSSLLPAQRGSLFVTTCRGSGSKLRTQTQSTSTDSLVTPTMSDARGVVEEAAEKKIGGGSAATPIEPTTQIPSDQLFVFGGFDGEMFFGESARYHLSALKARARKISETTVIDSY